MKKRYTILHAPLLCFFSPAFYDDVARRWKRVCFGYLLLIVALTWLIPIVRGYADVRAAYEADGPALINQIPDISIHNGVATVEGEQPVSIRDPDDGTVYVVVDTTDQVADFSQFPDAVLMLTQTHLIARNNRKTEMHSLDNFGSIEISASAVQGWIDLFFLPMFVVAYVVCVLWSYTYHIVLALLFGALALAFAGSRASTLGYAAGVRLAVMALTPAIVISTVLGLLGAKQILGCGWYFVALLIGVGFLYFATRSVGSDDADEVTMDGGMVVASGE